MILTGKRPVVSVAKGQHTKPGLFQECQFRARPEDGASLPQKNVTPRVGKAVGAVRSSDKIL